MKNSLPARIHLLPAKTAPYVIVIRRKPTKWFHVMRWNTSTDEIEHGSWFNGHLYAKRSDVSFDGQWMVYLAMGSTGKTWNGVCRLPFLKTAVDVPGNGTWYGGGYWASEQLLKLNAWHWPMLRGLRKKAAKVLPFQIEEFCATHNAEDLGVLYPRLQRDGWQRCGENYGKDNKLAGNKYRVECIGDDGWRHQLSKDHPVLRAQYIGYFEHGYTFRFWLEEYPNIIDQEVDWAGWDALGQLIFSRQGVLYKYSLDTISSKKPTTVIDLEHLTPPKNETGLSEK